MRYSRMILCPIGMLLGLLVLPGLASAQWGSAVLEPISVGPEDDHLKEGALALDDMGDLHLLYYRGLAPGQNEFYYVTKPNGGTWSAPVPVGEPGGQPSNPCIGVCKATGDPYVVYFDGPSLKLAHASGGVWSYYDLPTPGVGSLHDPVLSVDENGYAHVAVIGEPGGVYKMCYGYWDGPVGNNFYFQIIEDSQLGAFGSGADPTICARSDGSVAIAYRGGGYLDYQIHAAENASLGGTAWGIRIIDMMGYQCYGASIQARSNDDLYMAFQANMGFGFPNYEYFTTKPAGAASWGSPITICGTFRGGDATLAMMENGDAHVVFMETSGNIYTGNFVYTTNQTGPWTPGYLLQDGKYWPTLVMDPQGNGSLAFQQEVTYDDNDVYYYGYVAPVGPPPEVAITLTPENPPIVIPPGGGSFTFEAEVVNNTGMAVMVDVWLDAVLPSGATTAPLYLVENLFLTLGASRSKTLTLDVPGRAPAGSYWLRGFSGDYPGYISDADSFEVTKTGDGGSDFSMDDWNCVEVNPDPIPQTTVLVSASPNPFNPVTALRYDLAERSQVELAIFDVLGREVAALVDRVEEAGSYRVTWSGQDYSAGVYFARLSVGGGTPQVTKLVLIK